MLRPPPNCGDSGKTHVCISLAKAFALFICCCFSVCVFSMFLYMYILFSAFVF